MNTDSQAASRRSALYARIAAASRDPTSVPLAEGLDLVQQCLNIGENLMASKLCESLAGSATDSRLIRMRILALARSGAWSKANALAAELAAAGHGDEETLGLLARTYKDHWLHTGAREDLERARAAYLRAYDVAHGAWPGINAATLSLAAGNGESAKRLAADVLEALHSVVRELEGPATPGAKAHYWDYSTVGEAALVLGNDDLAELAYRRAMEVSPGEWGNRASSRHNAELVLKAAGRQSRFLDERFERPSVVAFAGHMIDAPDRASARFPASAEKVVFKRILETLTGWKTQVGFSSAANGADILFLEALAEIGAEANIVLPHPPEDFIRTSVADLDGQWIARFEKSLARARNVIVLSSHVGDVVAYYFTAIVLAGLAKLRAEELCGSLSALVLWDLQRGDIGGTGTNVSAWLGRGIPVTRISPTPDDDRVVALEAAQRIASVGELLKTGKQRLISMLFADAVGFSKLTEEQIPRFVEHFLGGVRKVMDRQKNPPLSFNTWGDALYFTFESAADANDFALDVSEMVNTTDWGRLGLPPGLSLRIALNSGPAFEIMDPVIHQRGFTGSNVSRTARLEPITAPGCVYCTESHAAVVALEGGAAYTCEFVGNVPLAKKYGDFPVFSLRRGSARQ